jgi:aminocarboxymuconate-semialdehyde decarboxylase
LRVCLAHGGGTFFWAFPRIARMWDGRGAGMAAALISNVYADSVLYRAENVVHLCEYIGADHVVFGTDYPLPAQDDIGGGALRGLSEQDAELVRGMTAAGLLGR